MIQYHPPVECIDPPPLPTTFCSPSRQTLISGLKPVFVDFLRLYVPSIEAGFKT